MSQSDQVALPSSGTRSLGRGAVLAAMCLGVLIAQIDTSVVNLATHAIGADFRASVSALQWMLDAYNLVYAVLLLSGGLLADLYGRRLVFVSGAAVMAAGSMLCACAPGIGALIAGRTITGVGAALLLPSSLAIIRVVWPEEAARGRALGTWASCNGLAFAIGPSVGGLLIDCSGWRSVFLLAVPLSAGALVLAWASVPESADPHGRHFDLPGQLLGALSLGSFALAAILGHEGGRRWIAALAAALVALLLFLRAEAKRGAAALVPLGLFRLPPFAGAIAAIASMTFGVYGMIFLVPLLWQSGGHLAPHTAGLALMPSSLTFFLVSNFSSRLVHQLGPRRIAAGGTALIGCGLLILASSTAALPIWLAQLGLITTGLGMGLNTGTLFGIAVGAVGRERAGTASALVNVARMTGASLGVALLGTVYGLLGGGAAGFTGAMALGGTIQLCGALAAWLAIQ